MFERRHIEELLRVNGVPTTAPDEEIKSVLLSARWHQKDVETAMLVLRENTTSHKTHVDSLHKIFSSDSKLRPETISSLLGIDIDIKRGSIDTNKRYIRRSMTLLKMVQICFVTIVLSVFSILFSMWYFEIGMFHVTMR